jgi:alpha-galactosidase
MKGFMSLVKVLSQFVFCDDTLAVYVLQVPSQTIGLWLLPLELKDRVQRLSLSTDAEQSIDEPVKFKQPLWAVDPIVHIQRVGGEYPSRFSQGRTLRMGPATMALRYTGQQVKERGDTTTIITRVAAADGLNCEHHLAWKKGESGGRIHTTVQNNSPAAIGLELLTSFSLGGITPFAKDCAPGRLRLHRIRSSWAAEGRLESHAVEQMQLEPSASRYSAACERFGQVGTFPTSGFFPFVAIEDTDARVLWGAQLAWPGSWQMEVYRRDDTLAISGGLADREFGQWTKTLAAGESFTAPPAHIACVHGELPDLCDRLTSLQEAAADRQPASERDLPILYNDFCTTWGTPTHDKIINQIARLRGSDVKYFVIDAGWYGGGDNSGGHGGWTPNKKSFPHGFAATMDAIRTAGFVPGLWFEFENCASGTPAFEKTDWHLKRDGVPITTSDRRFWDMSNPEVIQYLAGRVIGLLREYSIGYLKVDYNETIGIGCDGCESLGEGLRRQVAASMGFFARIRSELPNLVIENCSSGGFRIEPAMMELSSMSCSDAMETLDIPIIAANLHRLMLPRQEQIWAVFRPEDDERRMVYRLGATFLGRMCISGDITQLTDAQWAVFQRAQALYRRAWPVIKHGSSRRFGTELLSYRHPTGWQAVVRAGHDAEHLLVVVHQFESGPDDVDVPIPPGDWTAAGLFSEENADIRISDNRLRWKAADWSAAVVLLTKSGPTGSE